MPVVVVTGASAGVGRAAARAFARQGASVALLARGRDGLEAAAKEVEAQGVASLICQVDVADAGAVDDAAAATEATLGPIDVWVNNAMVSVFSPVHELRAEEVRRVTEVTYLGYVHGALAALRYMRPRNRGTIVQVGSVLAHRAIPLQAPYCGAKHAIEGFTESLRCELLHDHSRVRVTMVQLPAVNTPQFSWVRSRLSRQPRPVAPIYQPEVAAAAIVWAAAHAPKELSVGGRAALALVANRFVPGLLDRYLAHTGYDSQQRDESADPNRPDNLFAPLNGDRGAHGGFDAEARRASRHLTARTIAGNITGAAVDLIRATRRSAPSYDSDTNRPEEELPCSSK